MEYTINAPTSIVHSVNRNIVNKPRELFNKVRSFKPGTEEHEEAMKEAHSHFLEMQKIHGDNHPITNEAQRLANMAARR